MLLLITLSVALVVSMAQAQSGTASVHGVVTDPSGAAVVGADVQLTGPDGTTLNAKTAKDGTYQFKNLAPGKYSLKAQSKGFSLYEVDGLEVASGQSQKADIALSILVEQQNLNVTEQGASAGALDISNDNNATQIVLKGKDLDALPDDPDDLASDLQALAGPSVGPNGGQIYIDGFTGGEIPPKSSIREIRINQNPFSAEYDKLGYGRIEIFTKPGTDKWHGQVSVTGNTKAFNAKNPFAQEEPDYNSELYSGSVGGPLNKKTSFFFSFDRRNIQDVAVVNAFVLNSDFQQVPFSTSVLVPRTRTVLTPRFDFQLTPNNTLTVRYQYWHDTDQNGGVGQFALPSQGQNSTETENSIQLSDTQLFGTKVVNETRFSWQRVRSQLSPVSTDTTVNVIGAFLGGGNSSQFVSDNQDNIEFDNYTSVLTGKHLIKFGARVRDGREANYANSNFNGTFTFDSLTSYQITEQGIANGLTPEQIRAQGGEPSQFFFVTGIPSIAVNEVDVGLYVQDEWKWKPNFSISAGLRYEWQNEIPHQNSVAPRIAFAWGLGHSNNPSPKMVLRAGWGIFYDRFDKMYVLIADRQNGINQTQYIVNEPNFFPNIPPVNEINTGKIFPTVYQIAPNLQPEYTEQVAVSLERQLTKDANMAVSYLNSRGVHQYLSRNANAPLPGTYNPNDPTSGVRPFGDIGNIYQYASIGDFKQNQLIVNGNWRRGARLTLFGWYVLNYVDANTNGASSFLFDQYNPQLSYGPSAYDVHSRAFVGGTFLAPKGFRLSPFFVVSSSQPFNITTGQDYNGDSIFNDRPTFATGTGPNIVVTKYGTFNTAPQAGQTYIPPYFGYGPGRYSLNLRVSKSFNFGPEIGGTRNTDIGGAPHGGPGGGGPGGGGGHGRGGGGFGGASSAPLSLNSGTSRRYTLTLTAIGRNITNHVNLAPLIGNLSSPLFGEANGLAGGAFGSATATAANRKIDFQAVFSF
jgi:Carboxypeptidase regulatory-like domain/TonB dependent receptor